VIFIPNPASPARELDAAMRHALAESLGRLGSRASGLLPASPTPAQIAARVCAGRVPPGVFGRYFDLVAALQSGQTAKAADLWQTIGAASTSSVEFRIIPYGADTLGEDAARYQRLFDQGQKSPLVFHSPSAQQMTGATAAITQAMALLETALPAWAAEIRALVTEVIVLDARDTGMSGGSSMLLWGTVLLNVAKPCRRISALSVLAHEATHLLLFGLARHGPLVSNPSEEKFSTPSRPVLRPMNALYHSSYVSGRLAALFRLLANCSALDSAELAELAGLRELQRTRFLEGFEVIMARAQLTPLGQELLEEAHRLLD
jgi:HEXXH motif-containing protein